MCHHADLTVTLQRRETYSARGRGLALFAAEQGTLPLDTELADVMYGFFADGLCRHVCAGHIPHDEMVIDARHRLVVSGRAPEAVKQVKSKILESGNPWGQAEPDLSSLPGVSARADVLVYFGPNARVERPAVLNALANLLRAAGVRFSVLRDEGDPGLLLYQLGEIDAGEQAANALARKVSESGAQTVITPDADAYRTMKVGFGDVTPQSMIKVQHTSEFLSHFAGRLPLRRRKGLRVAYHDPCALARFASCLDAPRAMLRMVTDLESLEIGVWNRELANCSGECGGVPFTHPALARKAAEHRIQAAREVGAELVVAGSPGAAAALEGSGLAVQELCEFLEASLE
jgi:Fe-S oxidoreductase